MALPTTKTRARRNYNEAVRKTAAILGNTAAMCRKAYIYPYLCDHYERGDEHLIRVLKGMERAKQDRQKLEQGLATYLRSAIKS